MRAAVDTMCESTSQTRSILVSCDDLLKLEIITRCGIKNLFTFTSAATHLPNLHVASLPLLPPSREPNSTAQVKSRSHQVTSHILQNNNHAEGHHAHQQLIAPTSSLSATNPDSSANMEILSHVNNIQDYAKNLQNTRLSSLKHPTEFFNWRQVSKPKDTQEYLKRASYNV